jgi:hypothetical protein
LIISIEAVGSAGAIFAWFAVAIFGVTPVLLAAGCVAGGFAAACG